MSYPTIDAHRFLYNQDGTEVRYNNTYDFNNGIVGGLTQVELDKLNGESGGFYSGGVVYQKCIWFFFPSPRRITWANIRAGASGTSSNRRVDSIIEGSNDTTDGINGTWTDIGTSGMIQNGSNTTRPMADWWRKPFKMASPIAETSFKVVRFKMDGYSDPYLSNIHFYGQMEHEEDDIVFLKADGATPYDTLHDFEATEEGSTYDVDMYIRNISSSFTAGGVKVAVGGQDAANISISLDGISYASEVNIPSLDMGATKLIKVRNTVGNPPQSLQPRSAYLRATTESWT